MRLDQISTWHVRKYKSERAKEINRLTGEPVSPKTVNRELSTIRRMFNVAKQWEVVRDNPCDGVQLFPEKQNKAEFLYPEECRDLIDAAEDYFRPVLIVAIHTGMRKGEILGLTWDQVDFDNRIIRLDEGKTVKTSLEYVPINNTVVEALSRLPRRDEFVFHREVGNGRLYDVRKPLLAALEKSGIAEQRRRLGKHPLRFHDLRHTTASLMVIFGQPLEAAQAMLRHKDIKTTQRYAHLSPRYMRDAATLLEQCITTDTKTDTGGRNDVKQGIAGEAKVAYNAKGFG